MENNKDYYIKGLISPENLHHQVEAVTYHVLSVGGTAYYEALGTLPERVKATAMVLFMQGDCTSYHAKIIRHALKTYKLGEGILNSDMPSVDVSDI